jgi:hypothetical protein
VFFEQPSSAAIRFAPQPNSFNFTIAATSSGVRIISPRTSSTCGLVCTFIGISKDLLLHLRRGSVPVVVRGSVYGVA